MSVQELAPITHELAVNYELPEAVLASNEAVAGQSHQTAEVQPAAATQATKREYVDQVFADAFYAEAARLHVPAEALTANQPDLFVAAAEAAAEKAVADYESEVALQLADDKFKAEADRLNAEVEAKRVEREENVKFLATLSETELHVMMDGSMAAAERLTDFTWRDDNGNAVVTPMSELNQQFAVTPDAAPASVEQPMVQPQSQSRAEAMKGGQFFDGAFDGHQLSPAIIAAESVAASMTAEQHDGVPQPQAGATPEGANGSDYVTHNLGQEMAFTGEAGSLADADIVPMGTRTHPSPRPDARVRTKAPTASTVRPPMSGNNQTSWPAADESVTRPVNTTPGSAEPWRFTEPDGSFTTDRRTGTRDAAPLVNPYTSRRRSVDTLPSRDAADAETVIIPAVREVADEAESTELIPAVAAPTEPKAKGVKKLYNKLTGWARANPRKLARLEDEFMPGMDPRNDPNMVLVGNNYVDRSAVELPRGGMGRKAYRNAMTAEFNDPKKTSEEAKQQLVANGAAEFDDEGKVSHVNTDGAPLPLNREQRDQVVRDRILNDMHANNALQEAVSRDAYGQVKRAEDESYESYEARVDQWYEDAMQLIYFNRTRQEHVMASRPARLLGSTMLKQLNTPDLDGHYYRVATEYPGGPREYSAPYPSGGDGKDEIE